MALLALLDEDPGRLAAAAERIARVAEVADWVPPYHAHSRPLDLSAAGAVGDLGLYLDLGRDLLPTDQLQHLGQLIQERGVRPFVDMCQTRTAFWTRANHNWPTVIAGQVGVGTLAAWEQLAEPSEALGHLVERIAVPLGTYPQDGSYEEGPSYWHYGLGECLPFCFALWIAQAVDLFSLPFLRHTAAYGLHVRTPEGGCFDVEDGGHRWAAGWMLSVLGRRLGEADARAVAQEAVGSPAGGPALQQVLFSEGTSASGEPTAPPMALFAGTQNVMLRSDWGPGAFFVGLHAGSNGVNHAHLDLGTFTVVAEGSRLLTDTGSWAYTLDYFDGRPGGRRWDYEPNTTAGHNAVLVDGEGQCIGGGAEARFHQTDLRPREGLALLAVDLANAYPRRLERYLRHFAYFAEGLLLIVDDIQAPEPHGLAWCAHPAAPPEPLAGESPGWRWALGNVPTELRLLGLRAEDGFVLSEARRQTRYLDRSGQSRTYGTNTVRLETLHRQPSWTVRAALVAGQGLAEIRVQPLGPSSLEVWTGRRHGVVSWAEGQMLWEG